MILQIQIRYILHTQNWPHIVRHRLLAAIVGCSLYVANAESGAQWLAALLAVQLAAQRLAQRLAQLVAQFEQVRAAACCRSCRS